MIETERKILVKEETYQNIACFVLLEGDKRENKPWFLFDLLGKPVFEWVSCVCPSQPTTIECKQGANVLSVIKPFLKDREFTLVLYGDTPLLTKNNVINALNFMINENLNVCALPRGFIFKTDYIKRIDDIYATQSYNSCAEEYLMINSVETLNQAKKNLQDKIFDFHEKNGVEFIDKNLTLVEGDVRIAGGAVIYPFVSLSGKTQIFSGAVIGSFSRIESSKIEENVLISGAKIYNSTVKENSTVKDGAIIDSGSFVGANSHIGAMTKVINASIAPNVKILDGATVKNAKVYSAVKICEDALVLGSEENPVRVSEGDVILPKASVFNEN